MVARLIRGALRYRWIVLIAAGAVMVLGVWLFTRMKIDAYPDISAQMVQVITTYPGRAPEEVERQVTLPVEIAMRNVPRVETIRSRTIFGLSQVQLIFEEGTESYWARQRVQEKLAGLELPEGAQAEMGPLATAYGEVLRYELVSDGRQDLMELRTLNDWVVIPRLLRAPGVAEVSNFGGYAKQFAVLLHPAQLQRYGLSVNDVADAIQTNNASAGGSVLSRGSMSFVIRGRGSLQNEREIGAIFIKSLGGTPIYIHDVADVQLDAKVPAGIFSKDLKDEAVEGIVLLRKGENPSDVLAAVQAAIKELNAEGLPAGVRIEPYYDRSNLIESTLHTVGHSVFLGIGLVILILLACLGRPLLAALVALTIPFALLFALVLMYFAGIPIGLLSIGAIDFGIIVAGAVIMAENIARRLDERERRDGEPTSVTQTVLVAALEVERPVFFSLLMILGAFLPLLTLTHIEGLLFRPMALTIVFALSGALLSALFVVPVLATFFFQTRLPGKGKSCSALAQRTLQGAADRTHSPPQESFSGHGRVPGGGPGIPGAADGHGVPAIHGRRGYLGARQFPGRYVFAADRTLRPAAEGNLAGISRHPVRRGSDRPQRQRYRSLSAQPYRNDGGAEAAEWLDPVQEQTRAAGGPGHPLSRGVPDHPLQLHPAHHRQRHRGYQRHLSQHGHRILRGRFRRPAGSGPQRRNAVETGARCHRREHRAGRPAAAIAHRAGPLAVRPLQRQDRRRHPDDRYCHRRGAGWHAVRRREAFRYRLAVFPRTFAFAPGAGAAAGL
jgi:hypothetical protein